MEENELQELLIDTQKEYTRSNKVKDKIIVLLIVLMFLEAVVGYSDFDIKTYTNSGISDVQSI